MVEIVVFERGWGHLEHKFQEKCGVTYQRLLASEMKTRVPELSPGVVYVILHLAVLTFRRVTDDDG